MKIEMGKTYRTRDGREVRIYAVDGEENYPVHGAVKNAEWSMSCWTAVGRASLAAFNSDFDLIEVRPRIKRKVWVNVYPDGLTDMAHVSKASADRGAHGHRLACVEIDIDVEEGHGL